MKLIIAGGRNLHPDKNLINGLISLYDLNEKVSDYVIGCADGVDSSGYVYAKDLQLMCGTHQVNITEFEPDYKAYGKRAPLIRNSKMAVYADALLLIWDGRSKGSADMKKKMMELKKPIYEVILRNYYGKNYE